MSNSTMTAIAPIGPWEYDETHPLAMTPNEEGRWAANWGDDLEDNPYDRTHNPIHWSEWHDGYMAVTRDRDHQDEYDQEFLEWCMTEAAVW